VEGGPPPPPAEVRAVIDAYPAALRPRFERLRALIFRTAAATEGVGPLTETLKWGEPAYLTEATRSGSTVRLGASRRRPDCAALFFHCRTGLVDAFRAQFPELSYEGDRAVLIAPDANLPEDALGNCIAMALTHHLAKRRTPRPAAPGTAAGPAS
jgi:hypothetical protein